MATISAKRRLHRAMRGIGLHVQKWRDPYDEIARLLHGQNIRHIVDGGAALGDHSARLLQHWPAAKIHAFEPQPGTVAQLRSRFKGNPHVTVYESALSDQEGEATLYINRLAHTTSLLETLEPNDMRPSARVQVPLTSLDNWAAKNCLPSPDVIKLDLQGHELAALRGATALLPNVMAILAEVNFYPRYLASCLAHDVIAFLQQSGFRLYRMFEIIESPEGGWQQADALFVRADISAARWQA